jgi:hypothetical protein
MMQCEERLGRAKDEEPSIARNMNEKFARVKPALSAALSL